MGTGSGATTHAWTEAEMEWQRSLDRMLAALRWIGLAAMLVVTLAWPLPGRTGHPVFLFVLVLAGYNLAVDVLRATVPGLRSFAWVPFLDLPIAGLLYFLDTEPGGPLFVSFYLAVVTAAVTMKLPGTLLYTTAVVAVVAAIAPTLPLWSGAAVQVRTLSARLIVLGLVGAGTALLARRLADEQATAQEMRGEAARLAELERVRADFLSTVSHDLRTPLTAARAGLGMLGTSLAARLRPEEQQLLGNVERNVERLRELIDDLLAYNQLTAGTLRLDREPLDVRTVVTGATVALQPLLRDRQQRVELDLPEPLPSAGDRRRLEQAVLNVLARAHQHTPTGAQITVSGRATPQAVEVAVRDSGPGIPAEELDAMFRHFYRVVPADEGSGGSGLGLAIARALVELHGGRLWAESQPQAGAVFHVILPRHSGYPGHPGHPGDPQPPGLIASVQ